MVLHDGNRPVWLRVLTNGGEAVNLRQLVQEASLGTVHWWESKHLLRLVAHQRCNLLLHLNAERRLLAVKVGNFLGILEHDGSIVNHPFTRPCHSNVQCSGHVLESLDVVTVCRALQNLVHSCSGFGSTTGPLFLEVATLTGNGHLLCTSNRLVTREWGVARSVVCMSTRLRLATGPSASLAFSRTMAVSGTLVNTTCQQLIAGFTACYLLLEAPHSLDRALATHAGL